MEPATLTDGYVMLRVPTTHDIDQIVEACQDPEFQRWTTVPVPYERTHAEEYIQSFSDGWSTGRNPGWVMVEPSDSRRYLGGIDLRLDGAGAAEVGFAVAPWGRGRGVCTAALRQVCRWGFADLGLDRIAWYAHVGNEASRSVAEKVGFQILQGTLRQALVARGTRYDGWVGDLLPSDLT
jgi:RimJ/RimL family protein N-acetyltransferase